MEDEIAGFCNEREVYFRSTEIGIIVKMCIYEVKLCFTLIQELHGTIAIAIVIKYHLIRVAIFLRLK